MVPDPYAQGTRHLEVISLYIILYNRVSVSIAIYLVKYTRWFRVPVAKILKSRDSMPHCHISVIFTSNYYIASWRIQIKTHIGRRMIPTYFNSLNEKQVAKGISEKFNRTVI